jgi:hypothetical protein
LAKFIRLGLVGEMAIKGISWVEGTNASGTRRTRLFEVEKIGPFEIVY